MKLVILVTSALLISLNGFAEGSEQGFCQDTANMFKSALEDKIMAEIGVIQGYEEVVTINYSKEVHTMDNLTETYHYVIDANNDEGDWWTSEYKVEVEAWLAGDGTAQYCDLKSLNYLGVTDSGSENN